MKFLIYKRTEIGVGEKLSSYESSFKDDSSNNRSYTHAEPLAIHLELPEGLDEDCVTPEWMELSPEQTITLREPIEAVEGQEEIVDMETGEVLQFAIEAVEAQEGLYQTIPAMFGWALVESPELKAAKQIAEAEEAAMAAQRYVESVYDNAVNFGKGLLKEFTVQNIMMGITADNMTGTVLDSMTSVIVAINNASLKDAIVKAKSIPEEAKDGKYITDARLLSFINKIETYLGIPLSMDME